MSALTRLPPLFKLLGKLRNVVAVPPTDRPRRPWDSASAREIQLELDLESRRRPYWPLNARVKEAATSSTD